MLGLCIEYKIGTLYSPRIMQYSQLFMGVAEEFTIFGVSWYSKKSIE